MEIAEEGEMYKCTTNVQQDNKQREWWTYGYVPWAAWVISANLCQISTRKETCNSTVYSNLVKHLPHTLSFSSSKQSAGQAQLHVFICVYV